MKDGSIRQRHTRTCPRDDDGKVLEHRCRGPWEYVLDAGRHPNGKRRQITKAGFATKGEARAALRRAAQELADGIDGDRGVTTGAYLEQWLAGKRALRPSTKKSYREHLTLYLVPHLGHVRLRDLRPHHVDDMISRLLAAPRRRPLSAMTVKHVHATLRTALNAAVRRAASSPTTRPSLSSCLRSGGRRCSSGLPTRCGRSSPPRRATASTPCSTSSS